MRLRALRGRRRRVVAVLGALVSIGLVVGACVLGPLARETVATADGAKVMPVGVDCAGPPPPQARAEGLTRLAFCDDFASAATIDMGGTLKPGHKWYRTGLPFGFGSTRASEITVADGKLHLNATHGSSNLNLISTYGSANGVEGFFVDREPAYFEARLTFAALPPRSSRHPAFWTMDLCHLYHWPRRCFAYLEIDFFEWIDGDYIAAVHHWLDIPGRKPKAHVRKASNTCRPWNHIIDVDADVHSMQTYGTLVRPEAEISYFFNDTLVRSNSVARYPWIAMAKDGRYPVILGSDDWPMTVDWVRVWVRP